MNNYNVRWADRSQVNHLIQKHYLHKWPGVCVATLGLLAEDQTTFIGVIVFALPPRETAKRYGVGLVWELARLFIEDITPKNTETWFMARAIALIKKKRPDVELLVSYADPSMNHTGTIYKAGNWISDGRTDQERKSPRCDYLVGDKIIHRRSQIPSGTTWTRVPRVSKYRYIYWMKNHEKKRQAGRGKQTCRS